MTYNVFGGTLNLAQSNLRLVNWCHWNMPGHQHAGRVHKGSTLY